MAEFYVKVVPDSEQFSIEDGAIRKVRLVNKAENGRANSELVNRLENILGVKPGIVSGHQSRRKKIKVDMSADKTEEKLQNVINNG